MNDDQRSHAARGEEAQACEAARDHGGTIRLLNQAGRIVPGLPVITKLLTQAESYDDEAEALASFRGDRP